MGALPERQTAALSAVLRELDLSSAVQRKLAAASRRVDERSKRWAKLPERSRSGSPRVRCAAVVQQIAAPPRNSQALPRLMMRQAASSLARR